MGWGREWAAVIPFLLVLAGRGTSGQQQQHVDHFAALGEDYPGLAQDYPGEHVEHLRNVAYEYEDYHDYYTPFVPYLGNTTLRKCRCEGNQVWDGEQCQDFETYVAVFDYWTSQRVPVDTSAFEGVETGDVTCFDNEEKVLLDSNRPTQSEFSLLESGGLLWRNVSFPDYCIDHTFGPDGRPGSWVAHICLALPPVPLCCPSGQALHSNGTCYPDDAALNTPLTMDVEGQDVTWRTVEHGETVNVTCAAADAYYHSLKGDNVTLEYDPYGPRLQWLPPFRFTRSIPRQAYCLGVELGGDGGKAIYGARFCYEDRMLAHREVCNNATCVRKCCPEHQIMVNKLCIPTHGDVQWSPKFYQPGSLAAGASPPDDLAIVHGCPICATFFKLRPDESEEDRYYLQTDGTLFVPVFEKAFPPHRYCIDNFIANDHPLQEHPLVCFEDANACKNVQSMVYPALLGVSCVFLAITLLVYVSVPELHAKVHGKCLVSHVTALLLAYLSLIVVQLTTGLLPGAACTIMASVIHVSFLAAFFWLNVMCFDIWWTLKSMRPVAETGELSRLRFKMYSVYSWGCPVFISLAAIIVQFLPENIDVIRPNFGDKKCWFDSNKPQWVYFYGFVLALVVANIIFFCQVAYILIMAQNDPILQRTRQQNRERMWLYIKLFLVMGLTWITEVISWQEGSCEAWIIPDVINALQGFSIFLIFICKRNMIKRIRTNWEPYLRRMEKLFGSSLQPQSTTGKGVQDTSSFTSSVNKPSHSGASQRTVQSQISLDPTSASRKLSSSSLVSTAGVQVHLTNSLSMDTITEDNSTEAEQQQQEASCAEDSQGAGQETLEPTDDQVVSGTPQSNAVNCKQSEKELSPVEEQDVVEGSGEAGDNESPEVNIDQTVTGMDVGQVEAGRYYGSDLEGSPGDRESLTYQGRSKTPPPIGGSVLSQYNRAFIADDLDDQPIQV